MCPLEDATDWDANEDGCIDTLVDLPDVLDELDLADKTVKGLNKKIDKVEKALDKGNVRKAIKKLESLIKKINKSRGKKIDEVGADMLVDYIENLIDGLVD
jgi:ppGpp synthetase/RelA/SpoT-type nucleotidyltranferase